MSSLGKVFLSLTSFATDGVATKNMDGMLIISLF
jgi:hypothetical protein